MRCSARPDGARRRTNPGKLKRNQSPPKAASPSLKIASANAIKGDPNYSVNGSASDPDSPRPDSPTTPVSPAGLPPTVELEKVGVVVSPAGSLPIDLEPVGDVGGAQAKFRSVSKPEKFYKTGTKAEAAKAQFFLHKLESYSGNKTHFNGPPRTQAYDLSDLSVYHGQTKSTLESCEQKGLDLLEMENLTHKKKFTHITGKIDIKVFPAYVEEEFIHNRGEQKPVPQAVQLN